MLKRLALLLLSASPLFGEDPKNPFAPTERKATEAVQDPLTGESFDLPIVEMTTEVVWTDRLLRPVSFGEHPRLRQIWVSPRTGFATYPDAPLWKNIREKGDATSKEKVRAALAKFPRRYRDAGSVPALHRYALALITYEALGQLTDAMRFRLVRDALYCARDEGNAGEEKRYLKLLRPLAEKRAEDESLPIPEMIESCYLAGEIARLLGDAPAAARRFAEAAARIERYKEGKELRVPARLAAAETAAAPKSDADLAAMLEGPDRNDAQVAAMLLVDRGAADKVAARLKEADAPQRIALLKRAAEHPLPALLPDLEALLGHDDPYTVVCAAEAIAAIHSAAAITALLRGLQGSRDDLLAAALERMGTREARDQLARIAGEAEGADARAAAAEALVRAGGEGAAPALIRFVGKAESYDVAGALRIAARAGTALLAPLRAALGKEADPAARSNLFRLAARLGDRECARIAAGSLSSLEGDAKVSAALAAARDGKGKEILLDALAKTDVGRRGPILEALGALGLSDPAAAALTAEARQDATNDYLGAIRALGRAREKAAILPLLDDPDAVVAAHAAHALYLAGEKARVLPLLRTGHWILVSAIARAAGETADGATVGALIEACKADDGAWMGSSPGPGGEYGLPRDEIADALRRIGGKEAEAFLKTLGGVIR